MLLAELHRSFAAKNASQDDNDRKLTILRGSLLEVLHISPL